MNGRRQYQDAFDDSLKKFRNKKPHVMADLSSSRWETPFLKLNYLNIPLAVNWDTGEMIPDDLWFEEKVIILQYLAESCGIAHLPARWLSFLELPEGQHHYHPFMKEAIEPLAQKFGANLDLFRKAAEKLGGVPVQGGDAAFEMGVFPKISLMLMLWEKDEGFPARANILFDGNVSCHLPTATLYMLGICVSRRLLIS
ncbi:DUF3786 domain-containing protein [Candidatus Formimonas warabiya]|uniref:DUF3786 domain-containing protein n=1 Tax=Formimonas warabiya TaxID=1761012 RepID=A0A3G1KTC7_FORW1|nr:DUF3786 domain-containing protein [Candidatus Formimonas warabiya]ATW25709.1 hypothetical protein DCMF_13890 [Candidatus Formimonas warabiya]